MTTTQVKCWNCGQMFEVDGNDTRPYVYHKCNGGEMMYAHSNPNLIRRMPVFTPNRPPMHPSPKRDHLLREYFGYSFKQKKLDEEEDEGAGTYG